jgi:lysophospholipase L1-like esterase
VATSRCEPPARYAALGDSFTAGAPDAAEPPWPDRLATRLRLASPGLAYRNLGRVGATSGVMLRDQLPRALAFEPDLVTVVCGANDVLLAVRPDIDAYASNLDAGVVAMRERLPGGATIVTATCADFSGWLRLGPRTRARVARGIAELNRAPRPLPATRGIHCLDAAAHAAAGDADNFAADGYHPSAVGHERFAVLVEALLSGTPSLAA